MTIWLLHSAYDFQLPKNTGVFAESSSIIRGSWVISLFILYKQRWCFCHRTFFWSQVRIWGILKVDKYEILYKQPTKTKKHMFSKHRKLRWFVCSKGCRVFWVSVKIYDYMILCVDLVVWQRWLKINLALWECLVIGADFELQVQLLFHYLTKTTQASPLRMLISSQNGVEINTFRGLWQDFRIKDEMKWDSACSFRTCSVTFLISPKKSNTLDPRPWIQWAMARRMISTMRRASTPTTFWRFDVFFCGSFFLLKWRYTM